MNKPKSTIALDDFEHRKAMQQLAAMKSRQQAAAVLSLVKASPPKRPEIKLQPPKLSMKKVVDSEATGKAFRKYREGLGLRLDAVAAKSEFSSATLEMLESGKWQWDTKRHNRIAKAIYNLVAERESALPQ